MGVGRQTRLVLLALCAAALWSGPSQGTPHRGDTPGGRGEREVRPAGRGDPVGRSDRQDPALWDVVEALEWTVDFFRRSYRDINLDGLYGLRIAEGQLGLMLEAVEDGSVHHTVRHVIHRLARIKVRITRISHHALHMLRSRDMEYFRKFEAVVKEPFLLRTPWKYLRTDGVEQREETMTETWFPGNLSDHCLAEVTGGLNSEQHRDRKCTVSERCWRFITASHTSGYTLSHQILWTILGEHVGCMENIDKYARRRGVLEGTQELRHRHCSSALHHMEALMHRGAVQTDQDMFLETSVLCGMLGYRDFLRADWLKTVLAWQLPSGCFGIRHTPTRRRLLGEKLLQHDCLSHKSGLGAAMMGMYARCMMDPACTWRSESRD
ncbi:UPF0764 protein C16orf89 homolog [Branchiostoma lanceolatum]|uniref:UPF0764 protein C16orf89 homolog n=1 Tax=Branchiostoma lanceolatum TaxID=7740 RepID=UPI0034525BB7